MIAATDATRDDLPVLIELYRHLEKEMTGLHPMWPQADGLAEPIENSITEAMEDAESVVIVGRISKYPFGFLIGRVEELLPQAGGERIGSIRMVFVEEAAREASVGEIMRDRALGYFRDLGITKFDAHVLPGHRLAKNFFEAGGFSARSIVMHHDDNR